jgi:hypothetical protein
VRVVCLGDSVTSESELHEDQTYPIQLESILKTKIKMRPWGVINAGVPSYSGDQIQKICLRWIIEMKSNIVVSVRAIFLSRKVENHIF